MSDNNDKSSTIRTEIVCAATQIISIAANVHCACDGWSVFAEAHLIDGYSADCLNSTEFCVRFCGNEFMVN